MTKVVVGIDFGTSGIGYAYSFSNKIDKIIVSNFLDNKIPSEIILDNDLRDILSFGDMCKHYIKTHDKDTYQYFKNIKMNLYNKIYTIKSTNGKEAFIEDIISKILKKISENAFLQIKNSLGETLQKKDIKWIVTIPAIWEEKSKQIMINASINAGLIDNNTDKSLFLALEPEVAGIYYYTISQEILSFKSSHIKEGKPYIICDIGVGTVDICTHRKININNINSELIEEYPPIGGDYGGQKINEEFIKRLIVEIFGEEKVKKLQTNSTDEDWVDFEKDIEELKKSCFSNEPCNLTLDCQLFADDLSIKSLDEYISEYDKNVHKYKYKIQKKKNWKLTFSSQVFIDITKELSQKIFSKIEEIYNNIGTGYILMTGAGSKNSLISNYLYDFAKEKNMKIEITNPPQPEISIIKGAVLFGFQSNIIRKRKSKYSIGIETDKSWDVKFEGKGKKIYNEAKKKYLCCNLFSKFITINQYIQFDEVIKHTYSVINQNTKFKFFKTKKDNCIFTNEKDEKGAISNRRIWKSFI